MGAIERERGRKVAAVSGSIEACGKSLPYRRRKRPLRWPAHKKRWPRHKWIRLMRLQSFHHFGYTSIFSHSYVGVIKIKCCTFIHDNELSTDFTAFDSLPRIDNKFIRWQNSIELKCAQFCVCYTSKDTAKVKHFVYAPYSHTVHFVGHLDSQWLGNPLESIFHAFECCHSQFTNAELCIGLCRTKTAHNARFCPP